jgi:hypothetical protein
MHLPLLGTGKAEISSQLVSALAAFIRKRGLASTYTVLLKNSEDLSKIKGDIKIVNSFSHSVFFYIISLPTMI